MVRVLLSSGQDVTLEFKGPRINSLLCIDVLCDLEQII